MKDMQISQETLEERGAKFYIDESKCAHLRAEIIKDGKCIEFSSHGNTFFGDSIVYIEEPRSWC